ncbi:MAG: tRNA (guanosine(37)-N1)-methyltransferase TrmD [Candidatus Moranbacteria bacterium]|nr:tRNA (guanosine(37)-N1)-methyltransferase TrmD [Candidatus Moranbacteria bacterium]
MHFDFVSLFPESFDSYLGVSMLNRAKEDGIVSFGFANPRDYTTDKHRTVDDTPYGGGAGMVMKPEPLFACVEDLLHMGDVSRERTRIVLFSAKGERFSQKDARRLVANYDRLILVCGRYEGVDERVAEHLVDEELSIGDYVLTGGELPAMVVADAVIRLIPGVLGNAESAETESHTEEGVLEHPQYTKPEEFRGWKVPETLLSGHHGEIAKWRSEHSSFRNEDGIMKEGS